MVFTGAAVVTATVPVINGVVVVVMGVVMFEIVSGITVGGIDTVLVTIGAVAVITGVGLKSSVGVETIPVGAVITGLVAVMPVVTGVELAVVGSFIIAGVAVGRLLYRKFRLLLAVTFPV
jgi:hypothetical protein